jgi:dihydrolipoamide dehydrogenase
VADRAAGSPAFGKIGEISLAIGKTIHPHPTLGETIGMAAGVEHGSCTDLPPSKK